MKINFTKMHGLGNDFVVINCIDTLFSLSPQDIQKLSHRRSGIGFDQLLIIEKTNHPDAHFNYRIFNADGREVEQCGNGARCIAKYISDNQLTDEKTIKLSSKAGLIEAKILDNNEVEVNMGQPLYHTNTTQFHQCSEFFAVSMGNPHAVIIVENIDNAPVEKVGLEFNRDFSDGYNVGFMEIQDKQTIQLRVFERGVGETSACGSGACAAVVAGILQNRLAPIVTVHLRGGKLVISWQGPGEPVIMSGPATSVYKGML